MVIATLGCNKVGLCYVL